MRIGDVEVGATLRDLLPVSQLHEKQEKQHEAAQRENSVKQLEAAKQQNVEKLVRRSKGGRWAGRARGKVGREGSGAGG